MADTAGAVPRDRLGEWVSEDLPTGSPTTGRRMRITNCDPRTDPEGIGMLEELVCGLQPIVEWLRAQRHHRPISVQSLGRESFDAYFPWLAPRTRLTLSCEEDWREIVDRVYPGSLLNLCYLQHEMLAWNEADGGVVVAEEEA